MCDSTANILSSMSCVCIGSSLQVWTANNNKNLTTRSIISVSQNLSTFLVFFQISDDSSVNHGGRLYISYGTDINFIKLWN